MTFIIKRLRVLSLLLFLLLIIGLACVDTLRAQLKKDEVDFEVLTTVTAEKGYNCCLWNMAEKHLGDPFQWKCIQEMNKIPNERRISLGTVVYIPAECKRGYVAKPAEKPVEKPAEPAVVKVEEKPADDIMAKLKACEDEKGKLAKALKDCKAEKNKLAKALEECKSKMPEDKKINQLKQELEECDAKLQRLTRAMKDKDATIDELEAKLRRMRAEAEDCETAMRKVRERDRRIEELEKELRDCRDKLEGRREPVARDKEQPKPPKPEKGECKSTRSFVAAMAIALVGSIVWIATSASD